MSRSSFIRKLSYFDGDKYLLQAFAGDDKWTNAQVKEIQQGLSDLDAIKPFLPDTSGNVGGPSTSGIAVDGFFGPETQAAIKEYKKYLASKKKPSNLFGFNAINQSIKESIAVEKHTKEARPVELVKNNAPESK
jgi:hypothetical protein